MYIYTCIYIYIYMYIYVYVYKKLARNSRAHPSLGRDMALP